MRKIFIGLLVVLFCAGMALGNEEKELCDYVLNKFSEQVQPLIAVEINSYRPGKEVYLYVRLDELALGVQAEEIGTLAVQGALEWLISKGHNPAKEWISVNCRPYAKEKGVTGQDLRLVWGKADYSWNTDQINWKPAQ